MYFPMSLLRCDLAGKVIAIDKDSPPPETIRRAVELVLNGEVIVCPTDTGYAFAANALDTGAIARVFNLKGRAFSNPVHVAVNSLEEAEKYAYLNETARSLAQRFLPGALTMILKKREIVPSMLVAGLDTVGIRIPGNKVILSLAALTGLPITTTSANISGQPTPYKIGEIAGQVGEYFEGIAMVLDQGEIYPPELSTIVDLTLEPPQLLRQGRIGWDEIIKALESIKEAD